MFKVLKNSTIYISKLSNNMFLNNNKKNNTKFFCDCNYTSCYCFNNKLYNKQNKHYEDILSHLIKKKITKNTSNNNYKYMLDQWTFNK